MKKQNKKASSTFSGLADQMLDSLKFTTHKGATFAPLTASTLDKMVKLNKLFYE